MSQPVTLEHLRQVRAEAECLCTKAQIEEALDRLAAQLNEQFAHANPIVLAIVTGGIVPAGLLLPRLNFPLQLDYAHATRYRGETQGNELSWLKEPGIPMKNRTVIIVDDILDEGITLQQVSLYCRNQGAAAVYSCVLTDKQRSRAPGGMARADFTGLNIPDRYVFGYGLDYRGYWRNADGIYAVNGL